MEKGTILKERTKGQRDKGSGIIQGERPKEHRSMEKEKVQGT